MKTLTQQKTNREKDALLCPTRRICFDDIYLLSYMYMFMGYMADVHQYKWYKMREHLI